jgi:hypothetical protein
VWPGGKPMSWPESCGDASCGGPVIWEPGKANDGPRGWQAAGWRVELGGGGGEDWC